MREDDAQPIIDAIAQLRGVVSVSGNVTDAMTYVASETAKSELRKKLWDALK